MVELARKCRAKSQLPFGWVCFSNPGPIPEDAEIETSPSQLPFGWVCFSNGCPSVQGMDGQIEVSIAFRLGLFL